MPWYSARGLAAVWPCVHAKLLATLIVVTHSFLHGRKDFTPGVAVVEMMTNAEFGKRKMRVVVLKSEQEHKMITRTEMMHQDPHRLETLIGGLRAVG